MRHGEEGQLEAHGGDPQPFAQLQLLRDHQIPARYDPE